MPDPDFRRHRPRAHRPVSRGAARKIGSSRGSANWPIRIPRSRSPTPAPARPSAGFCRLWFSRGSSKRQIKASDRVLDVAPGTGVSHGHSGGLTPQSVTALKSDPRPAGCRQIQSCRRGPWRNSRVWRPVARGRRRRSAFDSHFRQWCGRGPSRHIVRAIERWRPAPRAVSVENLAGQARVPRGGLRKEFAARSTPTRSSTLRRRLFPTSVRTRPSFSDGCAFH